MTGITVAGPEEDQCPSLLRVAHGLFVPTCELVDRCIGKRKRKFKLRYRSSEHRKIDGSSGTHLGKCSAKQLSVSRDGVQAIQHHLAYRIVPKSVRVRRRQRRPFSIVEDVKARP